MAFDLQPTGLRGELVELRPLRPDDFEALFAVASDSLIWEQHPAKDRYTLPVFRKYFDGAIASGGAFLVTDRKTGEVIGCSRYHDLRETESRIEIGFTFLVRSRWGGAYNGELKRLMLDHAFRFVNTVVFTAGPTNFRSRRALEKIGAVLQGPGINASGDACVVFHVRRPDPRP
jgi:N-acetyltransferase